MLHGGCVLHAAHDALSYFLLALCSDFNAILLIINIMRLEWVWNRSQHHLLVFYKRLCCEGVVEGGKRWRAGGRKLITE